MTDRYPQGAVVVGPDPFCRSGTRPYLVASNDSHPFAGEEYVGAVVTTTERERAVPLSGSYTEGGLPRESFVSPWSLITLKHEALDKHVAQVSAEVVGTVAEAVHGYLAVTAE